VPRKKTKETDVRNRLSSEVKPVEIKKVKEIGFSFRYFKDDNDKFSVRGRDATYLQALLLRLRDLSTLTFEEIINNRSKSLRCHPIKWSDTTEPNGFGLPNEDKLVDTPYQFQISANEHGRVHGFFIENIFYIVWLDPDHNLYS
jgi:hypothetical protein